MTNINININGADLERLANAIVIRMSQITFTDALWIILALILPPIAVLFKVGFTVHFWINLILTFLGFVPGQIHALWVVLFSTL